MAQAPILVIRRRASSNYRIDAFNWCAAAHQRVTTRLASLSDLIEFKAPNGAFARPAPASCWTRRRVGLSQ
jgi:hypothetical protein